MHEIAPHATACGFENPPGAQFCGTCGQPLAVTCGRCGTEVPAGFSFCTACGNPLADTQSHHAQPAEASAETGGHRRRRGAGRPRGPARGSALRTAAGLGPVLRPRELHRASPSRWTRRKCATSCRATSRRLAGSWRASAAPSRSSSVTRWSACGGRPWRARTMPSAPFAPPWRSSPRSRACVARRCRGRWLPEPPSRPASRPSSSAWRTREWWRATS